MGLDVYAVTKYEIIENPTEKQKDDLTKIYQPKDFEVHLGESLSNGMYVNRIHCGESDYQSGYGNHSYFREYLAELAGYKRIKVKKPDYSDPDYSNKDYQHRFPHIYGMYQTDGLTIEHDFVAIIHFSDCEGVIGNELCKVLDASFDKYMDKAKVSDWFDKYKSMADCVKEAAESGGYLDFH
ncbi:MAG: hypothetical protein GY782_06460 [Gammaproteobacteria bacterium]|nr:hypothetical protein [Gammaproteobacteria bacterium]